MDAPSLSGGDFKSHRNRLLEVFRSHDITTGFIRFASPPAPKEAFTNSSLPFCQEALFYWLTGWPKPDALISIDIATSKATLVIPEYGESYVLWNGVCPTTATIISQTGVDEVIQSNSPPSLPEGAQIYSASAGRPRVVPNLDNSILLAACSIVRRQKEPSEIACLRAAAVATSDALVKTMRICKPGMLEYQLSASFRYFGAMAGYLDLAFVTIVAGGRNSTYMHYRENDTVLKDGDLVLIDCGLFCSHYSGDVSRTFPINGKFSPDQALVYDLLLEAQIKLIEAVRPGLASKELDLLCQQLVLGVCVRLGVANADASPAVGSLFLPHRPSHHVGCATHDMSSNTAAGFDDPERGILKAGMVITIEPGIYFNKERIERAAQNADLQPHINFELALRFAESVAGIRIEDDVLVTEEGYEVLSTAPKSRSDLEAVISRE